LDERLLRFRSDRENSTERDLAAEDAAIVAALLHHLDANGAARAGALSVEAESPWKREARLEQVDRGE
jgi:hypothetical protein